MEPNPLIQFNLRDVYRIMFRHKWRSMSVLVGVMVIVTATLILMPRKYASEAQLLVNVGLESLNSDPTTSKSPVSVSLQVARAEEIKTLLDLFRSHSIAEQVVDDMGVDVVLDRNAEPDAASPWIDNLRANVGSLLNSVKVSDKEKAISKIRKIVRVVAEPKSNVIRVTATTDSAEMAQQIAAAYVEVARRKHSRAHETENSTAFLQAKLNAVKVQMMEAGNKLKDRKNEVGVVSIEGRKRTLEEQIRQIQLNIVTAQGDKRSFQDKFEQLYANNPTLPVSMSSESTSSVSSKSLDAMRAQLYALRVTVEGLKGDHRPRHPRVKGAVRQVEQAEHDLDMEELRFAYSSVEVMKSKIDSFEIELEAKRVQFEQLNRDEVELKSMQAEVDLLEKRYQVYSADVAKSQIMEDRRKQQITNINVFQKASRIDTPVSPNRKLLFAIGAAAAFFGAIGMALVSEFLDDSLKTSEEVESQLALPVLASIPRTRNRFLVN